MARSSVIASDSFNEASLNGSNWAQLNTTSSTIQIKSSTVVGTNFDTAAGDSAAARWVGAGSFTSDQYSSIEIAALDNLSTRYGIGVIARASADTGATRDFYEAIVYGFGTGTYPTYLWKVVNGTATALHNANVAWSVGDRIEIECEGTTIRVCKNGTALGGSFTQTDSDITTGLPGVSGSGQASVTGDNWQAGNITGGSSIAPVAAYYRMLRAAN